MGVGPTAPFLRERVRAHSARRAPATVHRPGVLEIDTLLGGWERVTAGYLIEDPFPC